MPVEVRRRMSKRTCWNAFLQAETVLVARRSTTVDPTGRVQVGDCNRLVNT
jgi:hypothetical protein